VQYIMDTARLPDRGMALAAALSACGKAIDRKVLGPGGGSTVLYNILIAETGAGKQHTINCIRSVLAAVEGADKVKASGLASVQAIEELVNDSPSCLVLIDEVGSWLARVSTSGTGNIAEIPGTLQSLWGWPPEAQWIGTKQKGKDAPSAYGPALAIYGATT